MEHAVIAHIRLTEAPVGSPRERAAITLLGYDLEHVINERQVGEFDGEEFGDSRCVFYMYGPDADKLFEAIEPVLRTNSIVRGGFVIKRYGEASDNSAAEVRVEF